MGEFIWNTKLSQTEAVTNVIRPVQHRHVRTEENIAVTENIRNNPYLLIS